MAKSGAMSIDELIENSRLYRMRRVVRLIPRAPRCKLCNVPFAGPGRMFKLVGYGRSRKNPNMCTACFERAPVGGAELDVGVLFADVRGYTTLVESASPEEAAALLAPFYRAARDVLMRNDAVIDKLVGDEVMALFIPLFIPEDPIKKMVDSGIELLEQTAAVGLEVGAGADFGVAYVGNVGEEEVKDFTALGDVVNTAARLQSKAEAGQLVLSERVYDAVRERFPDSGQVELELKGKSGPIPAHVIDVASRATEPESALRG
jgi:adenylate cyclase